MAFYLEKQKTVSTPYILVDEDKKYMKMEGRSFHENVAEFFREINDWLDGYLAPDFGSFTFDCELNYFNSSTAKLLLNMLMKMDKYASAEKKVTVNWITTESNEIIIECGEDFREEVNNLNFNLVINSEIPQH
uniref:SiaC family regulatory phosphoprotein domain-containing protein n=1 Tax=uncultured bacterium contig00014 TaxID=1181505 RepID=A0A806KFC5_9BACT|nr:hypothetical protein [uncultured bacterium contig00014]